MTTENAVQKHQVTRQDNENAAGSGASPRKLAVTQEQVHQLLEEAVETTRLNTETVGLPNPRKEEWGDYERAVARADHNLREAYWALGSGGRSLCPAGLFAAEENLATAAEALGEASDTLPEGDADRATLRSAREETRHLRGVVCRLSESWQRTGGAQPTPADLAEAKGHVEANRN
jgi:hypothetical protein